MKAHFRTANGRLTFEVEGESPKALFKKLALVQEIFDSDKECGCCKSTNIRFRSRQVDDYEFYELGCGDCFARLQFGQAKKGGGLFPKRKNDETKERLPNNGWSKFEKKATAAGTQPPEDDRHIADEDVPFSQRPSLQGRASYQNETVTEDWRLYARDGLQAKFEPALGALQGSRQSVGD